MKISMEKNLAFADQPKPLLAAEVAQQVKPRQPLKALGPVQLDMRRQVATIGAPKMAAVWDEKAGAALRVSNFNVGQHVFPPNIGVKAIASLGSKSPSFSKALVAEGFLPDHLALQPLPDPLPMGLVVPRLFAPFRGLTEMKRGYQATTVFPPDERRIFNDTRYPWCTCGRVDSPLGQGSGVMVGPRHLLTVSHVVQWNGDGTAGWIRFRPAYFAPSEPFGDAWGVLIYSKYKVQGPTVDWIEGMYDYVCVVLDRPIGNWTGWMGSKGYTDAWDGGAYWSHVGYPGDITGGNRPTFQSGIALDGLWWEFDSHESMSHRGDVWPGQSGGPFFGWWGGWPYAVAVQSSHSSDENNASGGQDMVDLIIRARAERP